MKKSQLLKGVLEGCVLAIIAEKPIYGYELMQVLKDAGFTSIAGGTLYPLLQKLEAQNMIRGDLYPSPEGPDRKYFVLTAEGKSSLKDFKDEWENLTHDVSNILNRGEKEDE